MRNPFVRAARKARRILTHGRSFELHLDHPLPGAGASPGVLVQGWIVVPQGAVVDGPWVDCGARIALSRTSRPDVELTYPTSQVVSFHEVISIRDAKPDSDWTLEVTVDDRPHSTALPVAVSVDSQDDFDRRKRAKLARIEEILRCSACRSELASEGVDRMRCTSCGEVYGRTSSHFDFLTPDLRSSSGIEPTDQVAAAAYGNDMMIENFIQRYSDGLLLDVGAGMKTVYYDNIVNLEIVDYPSSDVLGVGERLPFADESFDGAISLVVLEHVRDPFRVAAEIARVVKPGGAIYVAAPHMAPYHGYPHHYYNMTRQGLEALFADEFAIERSFTPTYGVPVWALNWFLKSYVKGLPPDVADRFKKMRVADLIGDAASFLDRDFVVELGDDTVMELATNNAVMATKRSRQAAP